MLFVGASAATVLALTLGGRSEAQETAKPRTYRMGFSMIPPKMDLTVALKNFDIWSKRADAAIDHRDVPWKFLLSGGKAEDFIKKEVLDLMNAYRQKGFVIASTVDLGDGLDRAKEAKELTELKRSIAEPEVQKVYVDYVEAYARMVQPDYIGFVSEVNLLADNFPKETYAGLVKMCSAASERVKRVAPKSRQYVSVQVDWAWGKMAPKTAYEGCERVYRDFPYIQVLGVSSYPAFAYPDPESIPLDYYSRLLAGRKMPIIQVEGGWPSTNTEPLKSDPDKQARYVRRLMAVLDSCKAEFVAPLMFADLDVSTYPMFQGTILPFFATMGFTDSDWKPKPALAEWDAGFKRPLTK